MDEASSLQNRPVRLKRPLRQRAMRVSVVVVVTLCAAYITLPYWMPTGWLADGIARQMSEQMGVDVTIGSLSARWSTGLEINDLTIASPSPFADEPLVRIEQIRAQFSPLNILINSRIAWMEVYRLQLSVQIGADGATNLQPLSKLKFDILTDRTSLHEATATLHLTGRETPLVLDVGDAQIFAGKQGPIGRITASASLRQDGVVAPISLHITEGAGEPDVDAKADLTFANVDLQRLGLIDIFKLPLTHLSGRCDGLASIRITPEGLIGTFQIDISVQQLDAQPISGAKLPVFAQAAVKVGGKYDHLADRLDISSLIIKMPGLDLAGRAEMFRDVLMEGNWQAIESIDLSGKIQPAQLASLLTGSSELPEGFVVDGPIDLSFSAGVDKSIFRMSISAGATAAEIRQHNRLVKRAGTVLQGKLAGKLDKRTWSYIADTSELTIGDNHFEGKGTLRNIARLMSRWSDPNIERPLREAAADLANLDWRGTWSIGDLPSLAMAWPAVDELLGEVTLSEGGKITGGWFIEHRQGGRISFNIDVGADDRFEIAERFVKPPGQPLHFSFSGELVEGEAALNNLDVHLQVGLGSIRSYGGRINFTGLAGSDAQQLAFDVQGRLEIRQIESLTASLPQLNKWTEMLSGDIDADYRASMAGDSLSVGCRELDLTDLAIAIPDVFEKQAGQEGLLAVLFASDVAAKGRENRLSLDYRCPSAQLTATITAPGPCQSPQFDMATVDMTANIADAAWLSESFPALRKLPAGGRIGGAVSLSVSAETGAGLVGVSIACDAAGLEYVSAGKTARKKASGVPLSVQAELSLARDSKAGRVSVKISEGHLQFGASRLDLSEAALEVSVDEQADNFSLKQFDGRIIALLSLDDAIVALLPEVGELASRHGFTGEVEAVVELAYADDAITTKLRIEADRLAVQTIGPFTKPVDLPASFDIDVVVSTDLSRVKLSQMRAEIGDVSVLVDGSASLRVGGDTPLEFLSGEAHVAVSTRQAQTLHKLIPALAPYELYGDGFVDVLWRKDDAGEVISNAEFTTAILGGRYRGKSVSLSGSVMVEDLVAPGQDRPISIGRFATELLEFRIGDNHGWVIADLTDLPNKPSGTVHLMGRYINDKDLTDWLSPPKAADKVIEPGKLSAEAVEELRRRAEDIIAQARKPLADADLTARMSIDRYRTFDASVGHFYEIRNLRLDAVVRNGAITVEYDSGFNGGSRRASLHTNLLEDVPSMVSETVMTDVTADEAFRPQLTKFFPGNNVEGYFNRTEQLSHLLRDLIANTLDYRYALHPVGTAKSVAIEGYVEGRSAPAFVTAIFPRLNLTKYRYDRMTGFAEFYADGSAVNDMIFEGSPYNLYMEGTTDIDNIAHYTVGLILMGVRLSPERNHKYHQGRLPLLKVKGRIEGGKMLDEEVSYLWPTESLRATFIDNNIVYRLWLESQKPDEKKN